MVEVVIDLTVITDEFLKCRNRLETLHRWLDDTSVQFATSTDCEGIQWYGTLKNLKPEGFMKVRLPNGEKYDGVWLNGQMQRAFSIRNRRNAEPVYHFH